MKQSVSHAQAKLILTKVFSLINNQPYQPNHRDKSDISSVMLGSHLTYRYILITNLLAKATNEDVDALALQAGSDFPGAFDSRSLCHTVIVEADNNAIGFNGKLGRSNEPYLNKPARYTRLTTENPVRGGNDRIILEKAVKILSGLNSSEDALVALQDAVFYTMQRDYIVADAITIYETRSLRPILQRLGQSLVSQSNDGESSVLAAALSFFYMNSRHPAQYDVKVHPVNQAGSSSREILDIDVYQQGKLMFSAEIKDKVFNKNDVAHAAQKASQAGLSTFFFIIGPSAGQHPNLEVIQTEIAHRGMHVDFAEISNFYNTTLGFLDVQITAIDVWTFLNKCMVSARVKDKTRLFVTQCASESGLLIQ